MSRWIGTKRLFGEKGFELIQKAHVCVIGLGGVGSWAVEALARLGIGHLTLIDLDDICQTNINRQVHALENTVGQMKAEALKERCLAINPNCKVDIHLSYFSEKNMNELLISYDCVVDAIDSLKDKCLLIHECLSRSIPLVSTGGAGGKSNPSQILVKDLFATTNDRLLQKVRKNLRRKYHYDLSESLGIPTVFSREKAQYFDEEGNLCQINDLRTPVKMDCQNGFGTASFVTGTMGFFAASEATRIILSRD